MLVKGSPGSVCIAQNIQLYPTRHCHRLVCCFKYRNQNIWNTKRTLDCRDYHTLVMQYTRTYWTFNLYYRSWSDIETTPPIKGLTTDELTHWDRDKMTANLYGVFKFISMDENLRIFIKHLNLIIGVQSTMIRHWFKQWLDAGNKPLSESMIA